MRRPGPIRVAAALGTAGLALALLAGCESFAPLREPPAARTESPPGDAATRTEVVTRFGPPQEIRASDLGEVLVYRRRLVIEANPARYYGGNSSNRFDRYERVLIYLDGEGRVVRWSADLE